MYRLSEQEKKALLNSDFEKRYSYSIKKICDSQEVWGLYKDGWAMAKGKDNENAFALWPFKEFANLMASEEWSDYQAKKIDLNSFLNKWLPKMKQDGISIIPFSTLNGKSAIVDAKKLKKDLEIELENY